MKTFKSFLFYAKRCLFNWRELKFAHQLAANQLLSSDEVAEHNLSLRRELVQFAYENIPFYRKKYNEAGFALCDMSDANFFSRLPILEKQEIRDNERDILHPAYHNKHLPASTTGGTTGVPLRTYNDPHVPTAVISWRTLNWWGTDVSANSGYLYRNVPEGCRLLLQQTLLWPTRRNWISAARMGNDNMRLFYQQIRKSKVEYLVGYVGAIDVFSSFLAKNNLNLPSLKAIWTTSAPLPEIKRQYFEQIFACPVYTQYGSCEFYWIAAECKHKTGMHIASDVRHVEIVNGTSSVAVGEYGDIVVTDLINRVFPLIRYRLGDRGRLLSRQCSCGLPFPLMDYVLGRISDIIHLKNGTKIPGEYWTTIFDDFTDVIKSFQVYQHADYSVQIRYEAHAGTSADEALAVVQSRIEKRYGDGLDVSFVASPVEVNDNGKTRFVISEVAKQ